MPQTTFSQFQADFFQLYNAGKFEDALLLIRLLGGLFPERANFIYNWRICLAALLGQQEQAIRLLNEALDLGLWWSQEILRDDGDLAILQGNPEFERLAAICKEREAEARRSARPEMLLYLPDLPAQSPYPLMLAFHGRNGNARETIEYWKALSAKGWLVAAPQSSQIQGLNAYCWDDLVLARREIQDLVINLETQHPIDSQRVILGGFSQGGGMAVRLALESTFSARGFIAVSPYLQGIEEVPYPSGNNAQPVMRGYLVTGSLDTNQDMFARFERLLQDRTVSYLRDDHPDVAHDYPLDFEHSLEAALNFIFNS